MTWGRKGFIEKNLLDLDHTLQTAFSFKSPQFKKSHVFGSVKDHAFLPLEPVYYSFKKISFLGHPAGSVGGARNS